ncbi:MAG: hypothetical protein AB7G75_08395 [Candidatus Binatia bacterium]
MFSFIAQAGVATGITELSSDLSILLVGLISLLWFSAAMLTWTAIREWSSQRALLKSEPTGMGQEPEAEPIAYRQAA